ncbi:molybdenum-dependent transcriptional regulator [Actinobacillus succinogenes]|uniref:Transcriptional regulator, ModE family n=1 Tax=Actinobacillus succinogenes (strain ATCC 55618 / DSM 22257 / CCUG 43843 / 130Z) TaxID=339671 RepID=A6VPL7_ACTSZ|nr:TOBE domain-containing protein [Actinobacillus succinogenes]ABR74914.1 transcriptional regulator, ModE family [Actinobacillus succinogenes 130Z]PHI40675.1 molybdenum-dependent transcriptional regulator [Actinobacillus succinogenes]
MLNTEILLTIKLQQQLFVDPKRIRLLKEIRQCGSINQAAKNARVSYKSAWDHLAAMNEISPKPLLERNTGGRHGGGTNLTAYAERLLQLYDLLEKTQKKAFTVLQDETVPLDSLLSAFAKFSLQSSARNQFTGRVISLQTSDLHCLADIQIEGIQQPISVSITAKSAVRLQLALHKEVMLMIKAPWIQLSAVTPQNTPANLLAGTITSVQNIGNENEILLTVGETEWATTVKNNRYRVGDKIWMTIAPEQIILATL